MTINYKNIEGARLAVDRYDFEDHIQGNDFNHQASSILLNPNILVDETTYSNVYAALSAISDYIEFDKTNGIGFTAIGDGYDTYLNSIATPDSPYDNAVPALNSALDDLLNNTNNPEHFRIRSGGVVLIKAGTYKFTDTVNVPPGIILMGEGYGTKIINAMSTPKPLFKIKADLLRIADDGVDSNETFIFSRTATITNMVIADNFVEPKFLGDLAYLAPINNDSATPLVAVEEGASLSVISTKFIGKTVYALSVLDDITSFAIATDSTIPISTGTHLSIKDCAIDGFAQPVRFTPSGAVKNYLTIIDSKIRSHGYLNADLAAAGNNCFFYTNDVNVSIQSNYLYAYLSTVNTGLNVPNTATAPVYQAKSRMVVSGNNVSYDRTSGSVNNTFAFVNAGASAGTDYSVLQYGNGYDNWDDFEIYANGSLWLKLDATNQIFVAPNNFSLQANTTTFITGGVAITDGATNPAAAGDLRLVNTGTITARDAGDAADILIAELDASDNVNLSNTLTLQTSDATTIFYGGKVNNITLTSSASYTVDSGAVSDYIILVDASSNAVSINLPAHVDGRTLIIKDALGWAVANNITLVRNGASGNIENVAADYVIQSAYQAITIVSYNSNWYKV